MYFDLFLLSVILAAAYLGPTIIRRHPPGERGFGWLLIADGVCAGIAFAGRHSGAGKGADLLGFIALAAGVFLLFIPPILRDMTRRAMRRGHLLWASRLLGLRELLQPGMGAGQERELLSSIIAVRAGRVDDAIAVLNETRARLDTDDKLSRRGVDERILLTYLSARRWSDAVDTYEREFQPTTISPQLLVEVIRAYCELGRLEQAATVMSVLESSPLAKEPLAALLIGRARLIFLAFTGRIRDVDKLLDKNGPLHGLPVASRYFWSGIARLNAGDRPGARAQLTQATKAASGDPQARDYAQSVLDTIDQPGIAGPRALPTAVTQIADLISSRVPEMNPPPKPRTPAISGVPVKRVPVTGILAVANLVCFAAVMWIFGSTGDPGAMALSGANVKSAVLAGEWWRLLSSVFLHVGFVHLLFNVYGLWVLGKLVEQIHGSIQMFAIYIGAGLIGSLSSLIFGGPTMSIGASGGIMGLLGALIAELILARASYPETWRKMLLGNLLFIAAAMVGIGFFYPEIDQSAHVGGLVAGALLGAFVSPRSFIEKPTLTRLMTTGVAFLCALACAYGAFGLATSDYARTIASIGEIEHHPDTGVAFFGPKTWQHDSDGQYYDPFVYTFLEVSARDIRLNRSPENSAAPPGERKPSTVATGSGAEHEISLDLGDLLQRKLDNEASEAPGVERHPAHQWLAVPDPWQTRELIFHPDGMGGEQSVRMICFGRRHGDHLWLGTLAIPDALADAMQPTLARMLSSMRPH